MLLMSYWSRSKEHADNSYILQVCMYVYHDLTKLFSLLIKRVDRFFSTDVTYHMLLWRQGLD